jgi:hypothetical protein
MKRRDYIPYIDAEFHSFQANLIKQVNDHRLEWNIEEEKIDALLPLQQSWNDAWKPAQSVTNRSITIVARKDQNRNMYIKSLRPFIQRYIYGNRYMSITDIIQCGLEPYNTSKALEPAPTVLPFIVVQRMEGNRIRIRYYHFKENSNTPHRGKPSRSYRFEFIYSINRQPEAPQQCDTNRLITSSGPMTCDYEPGQRGYKLWYYARWVNRRGLPGPWTELKSILL